MTFLCAADLHLGRVPSRLPDDLPVADVDLGPAAAWQALVRTCLDERPDALLLAGDLIDDERDLFGAFSDLDAGMRRLEEAGIPVVAIAGNHDVRTLPRLADALPHLTLLGRGGRWEAFDIGRGSERVRIVGWSFPTDHVDASPLDAPGNDLLTDDGVPTIGLLHADLDATASRYAPVSRSRLEATPVDAWLLGHVHMPTAFGPDTRIGYLGSLSATDPGESGPRGAWVVRIDEDGVRFEHRPLAPLRYLTLDLPFDGVTPDDAPSKLLRDLRAAAFAGDPARVGAVRLRVHGRVPDPVGVRAALADAEDVTWTVEDGGRFAFVHALDVAVRADYDLARLAELDDPVGVAARVVLTMRDPDAPDRHAWIDEARERVDPVARRNAFGPLDLRPLSDEGLATRLEQAAVRVLDTLLDTRERGSE